MDKQKEVLEMLASDQAVVRLQACEWLRTSEVTSPEIVKALQCAALDDDEEVRMQAKSALRAEIHLHEVHRLSHAEMDNIKAKNILSDQSLHQGNQVENQAINLAADNKFILLQVGQGLTLFGSILLALWLWSYDINIFSFGPWTWIIALVFLAYIGLQVVAIGKYGFVNSFFFLKFIANALWKNTHFYVGNKRIR